MQADRSIRYHFKLADFGLALIYHPGLRPPPIPQARSSPHQNPRFSKDDYDLDDDLYGVGYLMWQMQLHFKHWARHPDPDYHKLLWDLMNKTHGCNITYALDIAKKKCKEMISIDEDY